MSSSSRHHEEADRLLKLAGIEKNHISRGLILTEAQVHALLALGAATGTSPVATPHVPSAAVASYETVASQEQRA